MARTNAYKNAIRADISRINYRLQGIEQLLGVESEQYERYVNSITASLPPGSYTLTLDGHIKLSASKINLQTLKREQLRAPSRLPTAKQSIRQQKKEMQHESGDTGEISDEDALNELNAKTFVQQREDSKGKLKYSAEMKAELSQKGKKSYQQLKEIIQKGEQATDKKKEAKRARDRAASKRYYEKHREEILARRKANRAAARLS